MLTPAMLLIVVWLILWECLSVVTVIGMAHRRGRSLVGWVVAAVLVGWVAVLYLWALPTKGGGPTGV